MRWRIVRALVVHSALSLGCSAAAPAAPEHPAPAEQPAAPEQSPEPGGAVCHPIVSGCGCAYQCARGMNETSPGHWQVIHDFLDSALVDTVLQQWCFDADGRGFAAHTINTPPPPDARCLSAFFDLSPCGGECIPSTAHLGCHAVGDDCEP